MHEGRGSGTVTGATAVRTGTSLDKVRHIGSALIVVMALKTPGGRTANHDRAREMYDLLPLERKTHTGSAAVSDGGVGVYLTTTGET